MVRINWLVQAKVLFYLLIIYRRTIQQHNFSADSSNTNMVTVEFFCNNRICRYYSVNLTVKGFCCQSTTLSLDQKIGTRNNAGLVHERRVSFTVNLCSQWCIDRFAKKFQINQFGWQRLQTRMVHKEIIKSYIFSGLFLLNGICWLPTGWSLLK